jgi:sec-independent protein translocase protein TatA
LPGSIGAGELLLLALVLLVIFGPKRLPEIGRSFGRGLREFKHSVSGGDEEEEEHREIILPHQTRAEEKEVESPKR